MDSTDSKICTYLIEVQISNEKLIVIKKISTKLELTADLHPCSLQFLIVSLKGCILIVGLPDRSYHTHLSGFQSRVTTKYRNFLVRSMLSFHLFFHRPLTQNFCDSRISVIILV